MKNSSLPTSLAAAVSTMSVSAADPTAVGDFITRIKSTEDAVRGPAWQSAGSLGAAAVGPLAEAMTHHDFEIARSAKRAIERIVRHAGRPGADKERRAVQAELVKLLAHSPANVGCHALWMLSEIADETAVEPMATRLADADPIVREAARCSIERLPGKKATAALKKALNTAPEDFRYALAHSLRVRGEKVSGYPSKKLTPAKPASAKVG